ncbi:hypothetical protein [Chelativorans sp. AA-79]|uniref:hypothetical protein n=1 Tax=Chelativorans sp. AA-79 TaxID=3028735 RepID=UPI0023F7FFBE|nr:hypothetical protein [Chelativorans sp. AA-79]WEX10044.1 hypothetical protein PVE73_03500 [Chelativorans sp. AA-79]
MFGHLLALLATGEAASIKRRIKAAVVSYAAVGILAFFAVVFLVLAAYLTVAVRWGPIEAALWFGIGFLVLAGVILIAYRLTARARRRAAMHRRTESMMVGASALAMLPSLIGRKGSWVTALTLLAGLAGYAAYTRVSRRDRREED